VPPPPKSNALPTLRLLLRLKVGGTVRGPPRHSNDLEKTFPFSRGMSIGRSLHQMPLNFTSMLFDR